MVIIPCAEAIPAPEFGDPISNPSTAPQHDLNQPHDMAPRSPQRRSTETKAAFKTTEFIVYVVAVVGVLVASAVVGDTAGGRADYFTADTAWFYIVLLTIGYMISRGLAKSGSREGYTD